MSLPIDPILLKDITLHMFASAPREKKLDDVMDAETLSAIASSLSNAIYEYLRKIAGDVDPTEADAVLSYKCTAGKAHVPWPWNERRMCIVL